MTCSCGKDAMFANMIADSPAGLAVSANSLTLANRLELSAPSETSIAKITVKDNDGEKVFEIGEGKYASAIFVQAWIKLGHEAPFVVSKCFLEALTSYMGAEVMADARNPELTNHGFVRAVVNGVGAVTISVEMLDELTERPGMATVA